LHSLLTYQNDETIDKSVQIILTNTLTSMEDSDHKIPKHHKQAMNSTCKEKWVEAEQKEFYGLWKVGAGEWAKCPEERKPIMSKWTYALKTNADSTVERYKARICARGDQTKEGIDYEETFSPVVRWESIRLFLALTVLLGLKPLQLDMDLAYLYAPLNERIYAPTRRNPSTPRNGITPTKIAIWITTQRKKLEFSFARYSRSRWVNTITRGHLPIYQKTRPYSNYPGCLRRRSIYCSNNRNSQPFMHMVGINIQDKNTRFTKTTIRI
jgi:hypothetical protein